MAAVAAVSQPRNLWSERETWVLIDLWEERLDDLSRQKRNSVVYCEIAEALRAAGFGRSTAEVRHKIRNLTRTYRNYTRTGQATGSGAGDWSHLQRIHSFFGSSLPLSVASLAQKPGCSDGTAVEHCTDKMGRCPNSTDSSHATAQSSCDGVEASEETGSRPRSSEGALAGSASETAEDGPLPHLPSPQLQRTTRKRKRTAPMSEFEQALLTEHRLLRKSFEVAYARLLDITERQLKLQERLADAITESFKSP
ncbi:uncharacterized protein LOC144095123 [Amblyomma americanum]